MALTAPYLLSCLSLLPMPWAEAGPATQPRLASQTPACPVCDSFRVKWGSLSLLPSRASTTPVPPRDTPASLNSWKFSEKADPGPGWLRTGCVVGQLCGLGQATSCLRAPSFLHRESANYSSLGRWCWAGLSVLPVPKMSAEEAHQNSKAGHMLIEANVCPDRLG